MKQMILILDVNDSFDPGYCYGCPIMILDEDDDCYCPIHCNYDECPLIDRKDYDCEDLDK